ncbi:MAG: M23 family metallopeptidase [Umezawaea sp.]
MFRKQRGGPAGGRGGPGGGGRGDAFGRVGQLVRAGWNGACRADWTGRPSGIGRSGLDRDGGLGLLVRTGQAGVGSGGADRRAGTGRQDRRCRACGPSRVRRHAGTDQGSPDRCVSDRRTEATQQDLRDPTAEAGRIHRQAATGRGSGSRGGTDWADRRATAGQQDPPGRAGRLGWAQWLAGTGLRAGLARAGTGRRAELDPAETGRGAELGTVEAGWQVGARRWASAGRQVGARQWTGTGRWDQCGGRGEPGRWFEVVCRGVGSWCAGGKVRFGSAGSRAVVVLGMVAMLVAPAEPAGGRPSRWVWPLAAPHPVVRAFSAPATPYGPGHRGVDLGGTPGEAVFAAGGGTVVFAGPVGGRPVVSLAHDSGLRTTYEPVEPVVRAGSPVRRGDPIGTLVAGHVGCPVVACLHWGARRGMDYVNPIRLVASGRVRLLPLTPVTEPRRIAGSHTGPGFDPIIAGLPDRGGSVGSLPVSGVARRWRTGISHWESSPAVEVRRAGHRSGARPLPNLGAIALWRTRSPLLGRSRSRPTSDRCSGEPRAPARDGRSPEPPEPPEPP